MADNRILLVAKELAARLGDSHLAVIDCRFDLADPGAGQRQYEAAHIPGAVFLDLDEDLASPVTRDTGRHPLPEPAAIAAKLGECGISNSDNIVVYDGGNGSLAARAWWILRWLGHDAVRLLDGGFAHWQALGLPTEAGETRQEPVVFHGRPHPGLVLTTGELEANQQTIHEYRLLDARDRTRFNGEQEPIDPVAGHIPGAISMPFTDFLRPDGTWLPLESRSQRLRKVLGSDPEMAWSVMCGSGVTACHLAISGLEAGYCEPRVYVGSWSEWIRDPDRPIATADLV